MLWNTAYEGYPDGSVRHGGLVDDHLRNLKLEIRKRLDDIFANFTSDPDGVAMDLKDDVVLAEHISGLTSTGAVSLDNFPDGSTYGKVAVGSVTAGQISELEDAVAFVSARTCYASVPFWGYTTYSDDFGVGYAFYEDNLGGTNPGLFPLQFPHGAIITDAYVWYEIVNDDATVRAEFFAVNAEDGVIDQLWNFVEVSKAIGNYSDAQTGIGHTVDNTKKLYSVNFRCTSSGLDTGDVWWKGFYVKYTILPVVAS